MALNWAERIVAFTRSPSTFLSCTSSDAFLAEILRELRDDKASDSLKVLLLSPLCEYPTLLCPTAHMGEETSLELMSVFAQCPPKSIKLRSHLLLAITSVLLCSNCMSKHSRASQDFISLLLQIVQDTNHLNTGSTLRSLQATACDCLRELEACCPGLLSHHMELISGLRQQETSRLHQAYTELHLVVIRNAVYLLAQQTGAGAAELKALLGGSDDVGWEAESWRHRGSALPSPLLLGSVGKAPILHTGPDCKELRSILSSLLEESYLLTPLAQAALLHGLVEVVAMVPGVSPAIFRAQLLRLLGTSEVCLVHATIMMKAAFTDSLFSAEDEAFFLKRLVGLSQHPLVSTSDKLFYIDCILHFPENRPISSGDSDDTLPVLLTPRLAVALVPTVFNDSTSMLARLHLLSLVYLEEGEEADGEGSRGLAYLYDHLLSLLRIVENHGSREMVVTFFRATFLFLFHFCHVEKYSGDLMQRLCELYLRHPQLAPNLVNLAERTQEKLGESSWAVGLLGALQRSITETPLAKLTLEVLHCHLKILARVAEEQDISQKSTLHFLFSVITSSSLALHIGGDWRLGNNLLRVCRRFLMHPSLDAMFIPLADLLQHLTCHYGNTDIEDHARLYYALLTTLSQDKLVGVLSQGGAEGGKQAKLRSLSSIMTESEELTRTITIQQTKDPILKLVKLDTLNPERNTGDGPEKGLDTDLNPELSPSEKPAGVDASMVEQYRAQFGTDFASVVTLHYQLTFTDTHDPSFDSLYSIHVHFERTDDCYEEVKDISVSGLFRQRPPPVLRLSLRPRHPYPTTLRASAIFTAQDGLTWHTVLPDTKVDFYQVFMPLPAPLTWGSEEKLVVFEGLWEDFRSSRSGDRDLPDCATSLFCCQLGEDALAGVVEKHFLSYLISDLSSRDEYRVFVFLPPFYHFLLKVIPEEDAVQFHIVTDNWKLLPFINSFLLSVTKPIEDSTADG